MKGQISGWKHIFRLLGIMVFAALFAVCINLTHPHNTEPAAAPVIHPFFRIDERHVHSDHAHREHLDIGANVIWLLSDHGHDIRGPIR